MPSLDDADPAGDVLLVLETDEDGILTQSPIRVSSKVLSLASPVFAKMLSPKFAEGQALRNATSLETPPISLPDDDPEAMIWLCKALHFTKDLTADISLSLLKNLATVCDKYDLVGTLYPWSHVWLQKWFGSADSVDDHLDTLWISYALGNEEYFWRSSRSLMYLCTTEDLAAFRNDSNTALLPERVDRILGRCSVPSFVFNGIPCRHRLTTWRLDCINDYREAALIELHKTFQDIMAPLLEHECKGADYHNRDIKYACDHLTKIGYYFAQLSKSGLWPITQKLRTTSFITTSAALSKFKGDWDENVKFNPCCSSPKIVTSRLYKEATKAATEKLKGLCLSCVEHGRFTKENPNCRNSRRQACEG